MDPNAWSTSTTHLTLFIVLSCNAASTAVVSSTNDGASSPPRTPSAVLTSALFMNQVTSAARASSGESDATSNCVEWPVAFCSHAVTLSRSSVAERWRRHDEAHEVERHRGGGYQD